MEKSFKVGGKKSLAYVNLSNSLSQFILEFFLSPFSPLLTLFQLQKHQHSHQAKGCDGLKFKVGPKHLLHRNNEIIWRINLRSGFCLNPTPSSHRLYRQTHCPCSEYKCQCSLWLSFHQTRVARYYLNPHFLSPGTWVLKQ